MHQGTRRVLSRDLAPREMAAFRAFYGNLSKEMRDRAAFTSMASVMLNLDPTFTR
jgi:hypothetical protein